MTTRKPTQVVTLGGFIGYWVLRGIARQIGVDARSGVLSARGLFRVWVARKWQQVPRPVRVTLFAVGVTGRTAYRAGRYSARTVAAGARHGVSEGREQHREHWELRGLRQQMDHHALWRRATGTTRVTTSGQLLHDAYYDAVDRVMDARELRRYEHRYGKAEGRARFREDRELEVIDDEIVENQERDLAALRAAGTPRDTLLRQWQYRHDFPAPSEKYLRLHDKYYRTVDRINADRARRAGAPIPLPKMGPDGYHYDGYREEEGRGGGPDPLVASSATPQYPGPDDGSPDHAPRLAAWQQWRARQPGGANFVPQPREWMECPDCVGDGCETCGGDGVVPTWLKDPNVVGEDAARTWGWTGNENQDNNDGGTAMTAPTNTASGDVVSIADLRDIYQRTAPAMAGVQEHQAAAAQGFREQATAYEAAVGGLTAEGHDSQTVAEASAAMEAMHNAATKADEAAAAADAAQAAIGGALQGLERHRALEEAVGSHAGPARSTDAYAPR